MQKNDAMLTIKLPARLKDTIEAVADDNFVSVSDVARQILASGVAELTEELNGMRNSAAEINKTRRISDALNAVGGR